MKWEFHRKSQAAADESHNPAARSSGRHFSIELSKRGFPVLCVIRNESAVENILRKVGKLSIAVTNNRFGFHDPFAIRQIGEALDEFFHCPNPQIVQSFGSRTTSQ